jgi:hypothetical protein
MCSCPRVLRASNPADHGDVQHRRPMRSINLTTRLCAAPFIRRTDAPLMLSADFSAMAAPQCCSEACSSTKISVQRRRRSFQRWQAKFEVPQLFPHQSQRQAPLRPRVRILCRVMIVAGPRIATLDETGAYGGPAGLPKRKFTAPAPVYSPPRMVIACFLP